MTVMRVMTYNILDGGVDDDGSDRWPLLLEVINTSKPDLLVLDECSHFDANGYRNLHRMERETGLRGLLAESTTGYHVALLVGTDIDIIEHHPLQGPHHASLWVRCVRRGLPFAILAAHLCPFGGQTRLMEAEALTRAAKLDEWVFIAGDMNAISPRDAHGYDTNQWLPRRRVRHLLPNSNDIDTRAMALLEASGMVDLAAHAGRAAPTVLTPLVEDHANYEVRLDYVFGSPPVVPWLTSVDVITTEAARRASDHYPLVVELDDEAARRAA